jgi:hypothetical protein
MQGTMCKDGDLGDLLCMARHNQIISVEIEVVGLRQSSMLDMLLEAALRCACCRVRTFSSGPWRSIRCSSLSGTVAR